MAICAREDCNAKTEPNCYVHDENGVEVPSCKEHSNPSCPMQAICTCQRTKSKKYDLDTVRMVLQGWANQMASRFGAPVYLVGSMLTSPETARDVDVRIVLSDEDFEARYGINAIDWIHEGWTSWSPGRKRWGEDMVKLARQSRGGFTLAGGMNLDFQVHPASQAITFKDKPRERLDQLDLSGIDADG